MAIFRGIGGAGDSTTDATVTAVTQQATNAANSATAAASSASSAATSATNAATSETNAATSATNAAASETAASASETAAAASETAAAASETAAAASETAAAASETAAAASESAAATSETNAAASASAASTSETNAAASASAASTSASNAATSATNASNAQTAAEAAQAAAEAAQEAIDGLYLGAQASDPTLDNNGNAVTAGDWYYNTSTSVTRIYDGSVWQNGAVSTAGFLLSGNNLSDLDNAATARTNLGVAIGTDVQAYSSVLAATTASFTTADETKLDGIETAATADQTAQEIANAIDADATAETTLKSALGLGTAAYTASTDYATAAQGTLANSATQPGDNISTLTNDSGYLTSETSHDDVVVDGDFASQGLMKRGATSGSYSIVTDNSTNWDTAYGWGNHASAGYLTGITGQSIKNLSDVYSSMSPTDGQLLTYDTTNGWQAEDAPASGGFDSGTVMLFAQTSAPTGWTKDTTNYNNSGLRVVTGAASTGGSVDFTTAFASQTPSGTVSVSGSAGATTLSTPQIPSHNHYMNAANATSPGNAHVKANFYSGLRLNTSSTGGGGSHSHPFSVSSSTFTGNAINLAVKYVDVIRASKD